MAAADLKIVVGAQIDKSASQIREDLKGVQDKFDKRPLKIRIGAKAVLFPTHLFKNREL